MRRARHRLSSQGASPVPRQRAGLGRVCVQRRVSPASLLPRLGESEQPAPPRARVCGHGVRRGVVNLGTAPAPHEAELVGEDLAEPEHNAIDERKEQVHREPLHERRPLHRAARPHHNVVLLRVAPKLQWVHGEEHFGPVSLRCASAASGRILARQGRGRNVERLVKRRASRRPGRAVGVERWTHTMSSSSPPQPAPAQAAHDGSRSAQYMAPDSLQAAPQAQPPDPHAHNFVGHEPRPAVSHQSTPQPLVQIAPQPAHSALRQRAQSNIQPGQADLNPPQSASQLLHAAQQQPGPPASDSPQPASRPAETRFLAWKKNAQHLYDTLLAFELPWPSPTVQWIPELITKQARQAAKTEADGGTSSVKRQRLVLATSTGGQAPEYLRIAELHAPDVAAPTSLVDYDADSGTIGGHQPAYAADLEIVQRIMVQGTVARARHMPQNPNVMATIASTGEAAIWDITKFPYNPVPHYVPTTKLVGRLRDAPGSQPAAAPAPEAGHEGEGLCLAWSPTIEGELATGDADGKIFIWDLRRDYDSRTGTMGPVQQRSHAPGTAVNDLHWHPRRPATLASVGDDEYLIVHQTSAASAEPVVRHRFEHKKPTSVAWNPVNESLVAVGFDTGSIELWDLRSICTMICSLDAHAGYVTALHWNTWHPSVLASASEDGTVKVWNAVQFSAPPLFTHGGHRAPVTDVAWNPAVPGMLASVAEDNGLHIYVPGTDVIGF